MRVIFPRIQRLPLISAAHHSADSLKTYNQSISLIATLRPERRIANDMQIAIEIIRLRCRGFTVKQWPPGMSKFF